MFNLGKQLALGDAVASQLISHDHARYILKAFQQPSKEVLRGFGVPPGLNQDVEHDAILIHGTPKIVLHALDPDEYLVHVPFVSRPRSAASQASCEGLAKLPAPLTNRLVGDNNATFSEKQLNIPQAEAEHVIQPDCVADDLGGKAMAVVRVGRRLHAASLAGLQPAGQTRLT
jgi:hypothetical protein